MKRFVAMMTIIALLVCMAACQPAGPTETDDPQHTTPEEDVTPAQEEVLDPGGEPVQEETPENLLETDLYTFEVPEEWTDKFSYITGDNGIQFFSLNARSSDFDGLLCWIGTYPEMSSEQAKRLDETYYLGEIGGSSYIMTYPVNVNTDALDPIVAEEYTGMHDRLPDIVASFKIK